MIIPDEIFYIDHNRNKVYYTIIDEKLYYNVQSSMRTYVEHGNGKRVLFKDSCLTHNFSPFKNKGRLYAFGGQDNWKVDEKWRDLSFEQYKKVYLEHHGAPYDRNPKYYKDIKYRFDTTPVYSECRGLYLLRSNNGINWNFIKNDPVITTKSDGFLSCTHWKSGDFDGKTEIVNYKGSWIIFIRANVGQDRRHVQMAKSKDLLNWSKFQLINIDYNDEYDNYYHPIIFEYRHRLIGFFNYYNHDISCVKIKQSTDGLNWTDIKSIFPEAPFVVDNNKRKMRSQVCGVFHKDDIINIYVHHNYNGHDKNMTSYIMKYKMHKDRLNEIL